MPDPLDDWIEDLLKLDRPEEAITEKQSMILRSAVEVFAEKGYAAASTNEIAKRAGVAEGTIFRHYKSKQELLFSIIGPMMVKFVAPFAIKGFEKVLDPPYGSFDQFLKSMVANRLEFCKKNRRVIRILLQEIPFQHELREQFFDHVARTILDKMTAIVRHFQEKGEILQAPPYTVLRFIASSLIGFLITHMLFFEYDGEGEKEEADRIINFILYGVSAENRPKSP
ncbi:TetR/AcrR family transcriptional regulator [Gorillibacterium massiliense]|uniref:TetR/AcrR family transcriptional regulator n=1 Tax=Gorillibacterium massiliense TaxID=1280390 RepID=UPI0004B6A250|nr:TetR/AcrR family transcriptional regulator [Gorillibacterium massiliense]